MKRIAVIIITLLSLTSCNDTFKKKFSYTSNENGVVELRQTEKTPFKNIETEITGYVKLNEDMTHIDSLSKNGYVMYKKDGFKLEAKNDSKNKPVIVISYNGKSTDRENPEINEIYLEALKYINDMQERIK